jgi:hypothetical protein
LDVGSTFASTPDAIGRSTAGFVLLAGFSIVVSACS